MIGGVDLSTFAVDFVTIDDDRVEHERFDLGKGDLLERVRRVHYVLPHRDRWEGCEAIGLERPAGSHGAWQVSMVFGAVLQCLPYGILVEMIYAATWKHLVLGRGNAPKVAVLEYVRSAWPGCPSQDAADAYCVARAIGSQLEPA